MTKGYPIGPDTHVVPGPLISAIAEFERLPIPGGICTLDGTIVGMNAAAEGLLGRPAAQVIGHKAWDIAPGYEPLIGENELRLDENTPPRFDPWGRIGLRAR